LRIVAEAIGVPVAELVCDCDHDEVQRLRSLLIRISSIANTMLAKMQPGQIRCMAEFLQSQIKEELPGTAEIQHLPEVGIRRALDELGRAARFPSSTSHLAGDPSVSAILAEAG
jgi:hypothetical protein